MLTKKSVVLSGVGNETRKAVLSFDFDGKVAKGRVRLYNFPDEPKGILSLGLFQEGEDVVKAGLIKTGPMLYTFACSIDKINDDFSCAVINFVGGEPLPLLYGKGEGCPDADKLMGKVVEELKHAQNMKEVEETLDDYGVDYDDELKEEVNAAIDNEMKKCDNDCDNCEYKKYYIENFKVQQLSPNNILNEQEEPNEDNKMSFYKELKPQIDNLFASNPSEEYLEKLIPQSKWVKVSVDESGNYYVLGLIYDEQKLLYICYGVPGVYQKNAPRQLSGYPVWFPLEESKPQGFGYWLSYQDAQSGESIKAIVE